LTDFCSHLNITPAIFHDDENDSDPDLSVSKKSSDIEEESQLRSFTQALKKAHIVALKKENKKKQGQYSKQSYDTLKCHKQVQIELVSKGFLPLDEYMSLKKIPVKHNKLTPESNTRDEGIVLEEGNVVEIFREESEESSDEATTLVHNTHAPSSVSSICITV